MAERELKLNSVRFEKRSARLALEEHGHCEVPAGCGGVILRWRKRTMIPVEMWAFGPLEGEIALDGTVLTSARPLIEPGDHVLAFRIARVVPDRAILTFAAVHDRAGSSADPLVLVLSAPDGTWRYTTSAPGTDSWLRPGFDDSGWRVMTAGSFTPLDEAGPGSYRLGRLKKLGAEPIGIDESATSVWARRPFTLSPDLAG